MPSKKIKKIDREIFHIWEPVLRYNIYYILCEKDQLKNILRQRLGIKNPDIHIEKDDEGKFIVYKTKDILFGIIWQKNMDPGTLVHEIIHTIHWIMQKKGIPLCDETDEIYAYHAEFIFNEISQYIKQIKKFPSRKKD